MKIALFVPCLVNHLFPEIARDTLELLEKLGHQVSYPRGQTCCSQMMTNSGCMDQARASVEALGKALLRHPCEGIDSINDLLPRSPKYRAVFRWPSILPSTG